jgi:two-component system KDP operon response regulator KdpE
MAERTYRILVVEDEPHFRNAVSILLRKEGYIVLSAATGEEGLRMAANKNPDVILLDIALPDMSGREVCQHLRQSLPETPIIYLTGIADFYRSPESEDILREADAVIRKPAGRAQILDNLGHLLRH